MYKLLCLQMLLVGKRTQHKSSLKLIHFPAFNKKQKKNTFNIINEIENRIFTTLKQLVV